jgi:hypothetical protein
MNQSFTSTPTIDLLAKNETLASSSRVIPVYVYASVFASLCIAVGLLWDISWHMTVGRDGLFSPPHIAIYLGAVISGIFSGVKVLKTSFWSTDKEKEASIRFWGYFNGSLGALFCIWGAFAMLTSAPFDDWWHNTYGLDVKILSPPHAVLGLGIVMIQFGAMISVISVQNRLKDSFSSRTKSHLQWMFAMSSGFLLVMIYTMFSEYFFLNMLHGVRAYTVAGLVFPLFLVSVAFASPYAWGATKMTVAYSLLMAAMVWILPLFPAEPKLSPVLNHITRFQPFHFPILLFLPALAIDYLIAKWRSKNKWILSLAISVAFIAVFVPAQWFFADFLTTEAARGWFFGRFSLPYFADPDYPYRYNFNPYQISAGWELIKGLGIAILLAVLSSRVGLSWGNWMSQVKR